MRVFVVAAVLCALVQGKPQYNYPAPSPPSISYGTPGSGSRIGGGLGIGNGFGGGFSVGFSGGFGGSSGGGFDGGSGGGIGGGFGDSSGGGFGGGISTGGTLVQKHIYVHVAPPEPEEFRPQHPLSGGQATKHYKIIFIKAPSAATPTTPTIPLQAQNQEKTLVYVLVKKPDDAPEISIPTAAPTQPSKPEVYFIRYKTQKEAVSGSFGGGYDSGSVTIAAAPIGPHPLQTLGGNSGSSIGMGNRSKEIELTDDEKITLGGLSSSYPSDGRPTTQYGPPGQSGPY